MEMSFLFWIHLNKFAVDVKKRQDRLPTDYPSFIKDHIKLGSLQTTALVQLQNIQNYYPLASLPSKLVIKYCETVYERSGKNMFWSIKYSGEVLSQLKDRGFQATSLFTYDFSTVYTTLSHNLIK